MGGSPDGSDSSGGAPPAAALLARPWCAPLLSALAVLGARSLSYADVLLDRDQAYWLTAAQRMADLDVPLYVAGWETKPPAVFLLYETAVYVSPGAPLLGVAVLGALVAAATAAVVAATTSRLGGASAGLLAGVAFALLETTRHVKHLAVGPETLAALPIALLAMVVLTPGPSRRRAAVGLGALAALAALCKQPSILYAPAGVVALIATARVERVRQWLALTSIGAAASVAVLGVAAAALVVSGAASDAYLCLVDLVAARVALAGDAAGGKSFAALPGLAWANVPATIGLAWYFLVGWRVPLVRDEEGRSRRIWVALIALNVAGATAALIGGLGFRHDLRQWHPVLAIPCALGMLGIMPGRWRRSAWIGVALCGVAVVASIPDRRIQWRSRNWVRYVGEENTAAAAAIEELVPPGERIFVWGAEPELYVLSHRRPCTRMSVCLWLVGTFGVEAEAVSSRTLQERAWRLLMADLAADPPRLVVDASGREAHGFIGYPMDAFPRLRTWVDAGYVLDRSVGGYDLYRPKAR